MNIWDLKLAKFYEEILANVLKSETQIHIKDCMFTKFSMTVKLGSWFFCLNEKIGKARNHINRSKFSYRGMIQFEAIHLSVSFV